MISKQLTDAQVEAEIKRLRQSPLVALAEKAEEIKRQRRQLLYELKGYEKIGKELCDAGVTLGTLDDFAEQIFNDV